MTLEFTLNRDAPAAAQADCIIVGAFADGTLSPAAKAIDEASGGRISALAARGDVSGKTGRTTLLHDLPGVKAPRVLVVGLGEPGIGELETFGKPRGARDLAGIEIHAIHASRQGGFCDALGDRSRTAPDVENFDAVLEERQNERGVRLEGAGRHEGGRVLAVAWCVIPPTWSGWLFGGLHVSVFLLNPAFRDPRKIKIPRPP